MSEDKLYLDVFSTPISVYYLKNLDLSKLKESIDRSRIRPHGLLGNGNSSYEFDLPILDKPENLYFKRSIEKCIDDYTDRTGLKRLKIINSWFNKMMPEDYIKRHRHERSVVSGAFYIDVSEDVTPLMFKSPLFPYKMIDVYERFTNYSENETGITPENGMVIIFPSWLEHYSEIETGNRTVISFNTYFEEHLNAIFK
jgi:hypothetical protein